MGGAKPIPSFSMSRAVVLVLRADLWTIGVHAACSRLLHGHANDDSRRDLTYYYTRDRVTKKKTILTIETRLKIRPEPPN
jgi:hypothetical protein